METLRTLTLVRHAQAGSGFGHDHKRRLTAAGLRQALDLGRCLSTVIAPQVIHYSSARRTTETAHALAEHLGPCALVSVHDLYDAWWDDVVTYVRGLDPGHTDIVIVGHQPTIGACAWELTRDDSIGAVGTATALVVEWRGRWDDLAAGQCRLRARHHVPAQR